MDRYEKCRQLIRDHADFVEFGTPNEAPSDERIAAAENALGYPLPKSYKWWLKNYGGGELCGEEIYSLYDSEDYTIASGDIVYMYRSWGLQNTIPICYSDIHGMFAFDVSEPMRDNEYPVYALHYDAYRPDNFLEFLIDRILLFAKG